MLYQNPAIQSWSRVKLYLIKQAKGGPSKLLLSFLFQHENGKVLVEKR
jgi:hypothetical protein